MNKRIERNLKIRTRRYLKSVLSQRELYRGADVFFEFWYIQYTEHWIEDEK